MTVLEALAEITSEHKWYLRDGSADGSPLRCAALRIISGKAQQKAVENFFAKFGYDVKTDFTVIDKRNESSKHTK